jgi:hypothetical protein
MNPLFVATSWIHHYQLMLRISIETTTSLRIQKARTSLILGHPFFGSHLIHLKGRECRSIQTMATDGCRFLATRILLKP